MVKVYMDTGLDFEIDGVNGDEIELNKLRNYMKKKKIVDILSKDGITSIIDFGKVCIIQGSYMKENMGE